MPVTSEVPTLAHATAPARPAPPTAASGTPSAPTVGGAFTGHERGSRAYRRLVIALFAAGVATFGQLYSLQGLLPAISSSYGISPASASLAISAATIGVAASVLPWAFVADRIGRVRSMVIAVVIASLLFIAQPFAPTFEAMLALRLLEGLALGALPAAAVVYISEEVSPRHAALATGTYVSGTTLGGLFGRLIPGAVTYVADWRIAMLIEGLVALAAAAVFVMLAPRAQGFKTMRQRKREGLPVPATRSLLAKALGSPRLWGLYVQGFFLMGVFVAVFNFVGFRLEAPPFALPVALSSLLYLSYLVGTYTSRLGGVAATRLGRLPVALCGITLLAAGVLLTLANSIALILLGLCLMVGGYFAAHAVISSWAPAAARGASAQASATYTLCTYVGSSVIGWAAGLVYGGWGWTAAALALAALAAVSAALLAVLRPHATTAAA
ncbi:MFS transporter [Micrococcales bacterium 31B]|nr:MFS transporter [Micrococcales bacterium 31B]